jgi:hypothetical protein
MKSELIIIPRISIHPGKICSYNSIEWLPAKGKKERTPFDSYMAAKRMDNLKNNQRQNHEFISKQAKRKLSKSLDYLLLLASEKKAESRFSGRQFAFKIAFITLTLPSEQIHPDNEIKSKCLNSFLIELTKFYHVKNYIWRSELQENGNIHFHIIIDKFVPWSELRDRWNRIINKLGYVTRYREKMKEKFKDGFIYEKSKNPKWTKDKQFNSYQKNIKTDFHSPNSTDIHSIRKIHNIKLYISKYLTKSKENNQNNQENENNVIKHTGRIWGCNQQLSNIKGAVSDVDNQLEAELLKVVQKSQCYSFTDTYFSVHFIDYQKLPEYGGAELFKIFCQYLINRFGYHQQLFAKI